MPRIVSRLAALTLLILSTGLDASTSTEASKENLAAGLTQRCFPESVKHFEPVVFTDDIRNMHRANRHTLLAGYSSAKYQIEITAYYYDRDAWGTDTEKKELSDVTREILSARPGAEIALRGTADLPLGGVKTEANFVLFFWNDRDVQFGSMLWLVPIKGHYFKLRVTYVVPDGPQEDVLAFIKETTDSVVKATCRP